ncbi:unnamed protein product [Discosporangium mesarthrocarpum]
MPDLTERLRKLVENRRQALESSRGIEFSVRVLTAGFWPTMQQLKGSQAPGDGEGRGDKGSRGGSRSEAGGGGTGAAALSSSSSPKALLSPKLRVLQDIFEVCYKHGRERQRLEWLNLQGEVMVSAEIGGRRYTLVCNVHQAMALELFNALGPGEALSFDQVMSTLETDETSTRLVLHSLSWARHKVLLVVGSGGNRTISSRDEFYANPSFTSPRTKVKLPMASVEIEPREAASGAVSGCRAEVMRASIARTMKKRKRMSHRGLCAEVREQVRPFFLATDAHMITNINKMISSEYIRRVGEAATTDDVEYEYVP